MLGGAPPIRVALDHGLAVGLARDEAERAGAHRVVERVIVALAEHDVFSGVVLLAPCLRHDVEAGHLGGQDRVGAVGLEIDGQVVDLARLLDGSDLAALGRVLGADALEREHHVIGGEGAAVLPFDIGAQVEAPDIGAGVLPADRQCRLEAEVLAVLDQALVDVLQKRVLHGLIEGVGIQCPHIAVIGPFEHRRRSRCGGGEAGEDQGKSQQSVIHRKPCPVSVPDAGLMPDYAGTPASPKSQ